MNQRLNIFHNRVLLALLMFFLVEPTYLVRFRFINRIYIVLGFAAFIIVVLLTIKTKAFTMPFWWIVAMYGFVFINTCVQNPQNIMAWFRTEMPSIAMCLIFNLWLEKDPEVLIDSFSIFEILIYVNLITILLFPGGLYISDWYKSNWFLGYKTIQIRTILPILVMSVIRSYKNGGTLDFRTAALLMAAAVTFSLLGSVTSSVGFCVFAAGLFCLHTKSSKISKVFTLRNGLIFVAVMFFVIVVFRQQHLFSFIIERVFHKDLTVHGRTYIWDMSIEKFLLKPVFGYGYLTTQNYLELFEVEKYYSHPHNYLLYNGMMGGIVLIIIQLYGYLTADRMLAKSTSVYSQIIVFCLFSFMFMGIFEALVSTSLLYPMVILGMKADALDTMASKETQKKMVCESCDFI